VQAFGYVFVLSVGYVFVLSVKRGLNDQLGTSLYYQLDVVLKDQLYNPLHRQLDSRLDREIRRHLFIIQLRKNGNSVEREVRL